jgi:hypothetical protein
MIHQLKEGMRMLFGRPTPEPSSTTPAESQHITEPLPEPVDPDQFEPTRDQLWERQRRIARQIRRIDAELRVITRGKQ